MQLSFNHQQGSLFEVNGGQQFVNVKRLRDCEVLSLKMGHLYHIPSPRGLEINMQEVVGKLLEPDKQDAHSICWTYSYTHELTMEGLHI